MPAAFVEFALRRRRLIGLAWLLATLGGAWAAATIEPHLSDRFDAPGRPAFAANLAILHRFHTGGVIAPIVLVGHRGEAAQLRRVAAAAPGARIVIGGPGLTGHDDVLAALVFPRPGVPAPAENDGALAAVRAAAAATPRRLRVGVTGEQALAVGSSSNGVGLLVETVLGGAGALVVLGLVFGSALAFVPILLAIVSILTTFLVLRGLAAGFTISFVVQFLVGLIGLGVSIDYSLLMVVRWREERERDAGDPGRSVDSAEAVRRAMATAGRSILVSGMTVGIGLIALVAVPVPFVRSIGVGGMLIPIVSVLATLTLLPGILATAGPRLDRRHERRRARHGAASGEGAAWRVWSEWVVAHRVLAASAGLGIVVALTVVATTLNPGEPAVASLAAAGPARTALQTLEHRGGLGSGTLTPIEVLIPSSGAGPARRRLARIPGIDAVIAPHGETWNRGGERLLEALPVHDSAASSGRAALDAVRGLHSPTVLVGGIDAADSDLTNAIYGAFPLMAVLIAVLTFGLLAAALRSIVLPLKAIVLNVVSVAAAFGVVVLVWQDGHGSRLLGSLPATGAITNWVPLSIFAFLYGLSMDYEVFILSRVREEYDAGADTTRAVVGGLSRTGRLVTSAALILFLAFVALGATPITEIKTLATGLAAGIALDATGVRALIVPALVSLLGEANWWWPRRQPS